MRGEISQKTAPLKACLREESELPYELEKKKGLALLVGNIFIASFRRFILLFINECIVLMSVGVIWTLQHCPFESAALSSSGGQACCG